MKWSADPALLRDPVHLLAFGFGAGLSPYAPGTFGTLIAVPIVLFVMQFGFAAHLAFAIAAAIARHLCVRRKRATARQCTIIRASSGTRSPDIP